MLGVMWTLGGAARPVLPVILGRETVMVMMSVGVALFVGTTTANNLLHISIQKMTAVPKWMSRNPVTPYLVGKMLSKKSVLTLCSRVGCVAAVDCVNIWTEDEDKTTSVSYKRSEAKEY